MKVAISSSGPDLNAEVDPRFGRCQYFLFVDTETMQFEALSNESAISTAGAGISSAQKVAEKGAELVLTGNVGPNAFQTLSAAGIKIITGVSGSAGDAVERFKKGELKETGSATVGGHFGMGGGGGRR